MRLEDAAERSFARHETFHPRYGWFRKAYEAVREDPLVFSRHDAPVILGVGKNMANAIRFWGLAAKLIKPSPQSTSHQGGLIPTSMAHRLFDDSGWDPYVEDLGTLWLLHWRMLAPKSLLPVWWLAFNDFEDATFSRDTLADAAVQSLATTPWRMPERSSLLRDLTVLTQTYAPQPSTRDDGLESPLAALNLITRTSTSRRYRFATEPKGSLPPAIVAYASLDWGDHKRTNGSTIPLALLASEPGSVGRAFRLSEHDLHHALELIVAATDALDLIDHESSPALSCSEPRSATKIRLLNDYYGRLPGPSNQLSPDPSPSGDGASRHSSLLEDIREQIAAQPLTDVLSRVAPLEPQVAARHSAQYDTLRVFSRRYVNDDELVEPPGVQSPYDGEVALVVGQERALPRLSRPQPGAPQSTASEGKPVVAGIPPDVSDLDAVARRIASLRQALKDPMIAQDSDLHDELRLRLAQALRAFRGAWEATFEVFSCRWVVLHPDGCRELPGGRRSAPLSAAADLTYYATPPVRNETLNRPKLTMPGHTARRTLLRAMVEQDSEPDLRLTGYGPEVAMYKAFLEKSGLHAAGPASGYSFREPSEARLDPAWQVLSAAFSRARERRINMAVVVDTLSSPPIGMKAGAIPVFVTAGLLARNQEVALYEHGTLIPEFTGELAERLALNPSTFEVKALADPSELRQPAAEMEDHHGSTNITDGSDTTPDSSPDPSALPTPVDRTVPAAAEHRRSDLGQSDRVGSDDSSDAMRSDKEIENIAVAEATRYERVVRGAHVRSVERENVGFDLVSETDNDRRRIEVKGRARVGDVVLTSSEFKKASELGDQYWLYVVFDCARGQPRLYRVQNPAKALERVWKKHVIVQYGVNPQHVINAADAQP